MTHPAQARDILARLGFAHVVILTDGPDGLYRTLPQAGVPYGPNRWMP